MYIALGLSGALILFPILGTPTPNAMPHSHSRVLITQRQEPQGCMNYHHQHATLRSSPQVIRSAPLRPFGSTSTTYRGSTSANIYQSLSRSS
ncbi:hypothetical protein V2G26_013639 [Clonostachys chloroleuca]